MKEKYVTPINTKADLHVHSKFSKRPSEWILRQLGCPESFTEPVHLYRIAKNRGMTLVTITDHNMIDGCLEIAHLPDTFISEEVTTYFPDDQCKVHVLVYNITEKSHCDIQALRENIFDLVTYLNQNNIVHVLAHPLYAVNERLTVAHFEKLLLLFKNLELNGARDALQNACLTDVCAHLQPQNIVQLAEKHRIVPPFPEPWKKHLTGGSDDHSSINIGRSFTQIDGAVGVGEFLSGIEKNQIRAFTRITSPYTLAHDIYSIAYQFYKKKLHFERHVGKDVLLHFLDQNLQENADDTRGVFSRFYRLLNQKSQVKNHETAHQNVQDALRTEAYRLLLDDPELVAAGKKRKNGSYSVEKTWYYFVNKVSDTVLAQFSNYFLDHLAGANIFSIFQTIGSAGALYAILSPYFLAFSLFTKQRQFTNKIRHQFIKPTQSESVAAPQPKIALFTDTFYDVNGVAITLQQQLARARKTNKNLTVITCDDGNTFDSPGVKNFKPISIYSLPEYPKQKLCFPSVLQMLNYCYEEQFTHIHSATPGPIGLAALLIKHILKLPFSGTYHTAFPQYAQYLTGDAGIEELMWKYTLWYYAQMDWFFAPSQSTAHELQGKGINPAKIKLMPRGIDTVRFHPEKRNGYFEHTHAVQDGYKILYVGRVSKEKNLHILAGMFKQLSRVINNVTLVIVGDGPYLAELQNTLRGTPCIFTGSLEGDELADVYASCDIFVFPSTTDTFGNVVLEAQASGIPVIVTNAGGPQENIIPGKTGLVVEAHNEQQLEHQLFEAVHTLVSDPNRLKTMGRAARQYMESRSFDGAFDALWDMYQNHQTHKQAAI